MTNQKWFKSFELADMLEAMDRNIKNGYGGCILDAILGNYHGCTEGITCRECIGNWLKAEKEDNE